MKRFILCLSMLLIGVMHLCAQSEVMINMEKENGVYKIPCLVNGAKMKFILIQELVLFLFRRRWQTTY